MVAHVLGTTLAILLVEAGPPRSTNGDEEHSRRTARLSAILEECRREVDDLVDRSDLASAYFEIGQFETAIEVAGELPRELRTHRLREFARAAARRGDLDLVDGIVKHPSVSAFSVEVLAELAKSGHPEAAVRRIDRLDPASERAWGYLSVVPYVDSRKRRGLFEKGTSLLAEDDTLGVEVLPAKCLAQGALGRDDAARATYERLVEHPAVKHTSMDVAKGLAARGRAVFAAELLASRGGDVFLWEFPTFVEHLVDEGRLDVAARLNERYLRGRSEDHSQVELHLVRALLAAERLPEAQKAVNDLANVAARAIGEYELATSSSLDEDAVHRRLDDLVARVRREVERPSNGVPVERIAALAWIGAANARSGRRELGSKQLRTALEQAATFRRSSTSPDTNRTVLRTDVSVWNAMAKSEAPRLTEQALERLGDSLSRYRGPLREDEFSELWSRVARELVRQSSDDGPDPNSIRWKSVSANDLAFHVGDVRGLDAGLDWCRRHAPPGARVRCRIAVVRSTVGDPPRNRVPSSSVKSSRSVPGRWVVVLVGSIATGVTGRSRPSRCPASRRSPGCRRGAWPG